MDGHQLNRGESGSIKTMTTSCVTNVRPVVIYFGIQFEPMLFQFRHQGRC